MFPSVCFTWGGDNPENTDAPAWIALVQTDEDSFTVYYGLSSRSNMTYGEAAAELGAVLMHNAACMGWLETTEDF